MTIDEYLKQLNTLRLKAEWLFSLYEKATEEAESVKTRYSLAPGSRTNVNNTENRYIKMISAGEKWREARADYLKFKEELESAMDLLLYWEGRLIDLVYIKNPALNRERFSGASDILKTKDQRQIQAKLNTAKESLKRILNKRGATIE